MSKPYRIQVQELIQVHDHTTFQIDQLPLVSQEHFSTLLQEVLQEAGWKENTEGDLSLEGQDGETYTFHPNELQIRTTLSGSTMTEKYIESWDAKSLEEQSEQYIERKTQELVEDVSEQLTAQHEARIAQFEALVTEATGRALKEIAEQLGDVQNIEERHGEDGSYHLTISINEYE